MNLSDKAYDVLKYLAQIVLPALATLYVTVAGIWNLPYAEAISGTIMAVDFFLGAILKISSDQYVDTRDIVTKVVPDSPHREEEE